MVESCVGAYLLSYIDADVYYFREDNKEIDFIVEFKGRTIAIEVKSGKKITALSGLELFDQKFKADAKLLVDTGGYQLIFF